MPWAGCGGCPAGLCALGSGSVVRVLRGPDKLSQPRWRNSKNSAGLIAGPCSVSCSQPPTPPTALGQSSHACRAAWITALTADAPMQQCAFMHRPRAAAPMQGWCSCTPSSGHHLPSCSYKSPNKRWIYSSSAPAMRPGSVVGSGESRAAPLRQGGGMGTRLLCHQHLAALSHAGLELQQLGPLSSPQAEQTHR